MAKNSKKPGDIGSNHISLTEYKSKYNAKKTTIDGITFDSKREGERYMELKLLQRAHEISNLTLQPVFVIQPPFIHDGKKEEKITYIADFAYDKKDGTHIVEDVKGKRTEVFNIKRKMLLYTHPDINFIMTK